jgi:hypothetical protein
MRVLLARRGPTIVVTLLGLAAPAAAARVVAIRPSAETVARLAGQGLFYQPLAKGRLGQHGHAIDQWALRRGADRPARIVSLGGVNGEQSFLLEYPNPVRDHDVPSRLVRTRKIRGPGGPGELAVRLADRGTILAGTPLRAWARAAKALTGFETLHQASPLGLTTNRTLVYREVGTDNLVEIPVFRKEGRPKLHPGRPGYFDIRRDSVPRLLEAANLELHLTP